LITEAERARLTERRDRLRDAHLRPGASRPASTARGVHHVALVSSDVERTVRFYQDVLGFPLTEMFENRDLPGSTHFFFDLGHGNTIAFFDLPGVDPGPYAEVLGGLHHLAISIERDQWEAARRRLHAEGVETVEIDHSSIYFRDPDGARLELISDPLGEMYGEAVL
jgi:catechol 2,3-dioxygenase-like lactoylglutathione lyase family enzyme